LIRKIDKKISGEDQARNGRIQYIDKSGSALVKPAAVDAGTRPRPPPDEKRQKPWAKASPMVLRAP